MRDYVLRIGGTEYRARVAEITAEQARIVVDDTEYTVDLVEIGRGDSPRVNAARPAQERPPAAPAAAPPTARTTAPGIPGSVPAPLPGLVTQVLVSEGQAVAAGQALLVMEAMKMENTISAPHNGTVRRVFVTEGASVAEGDALIELARPEMTTL